MIIPNHDFIFWRTGGGYLFLLVVLGVWPTLVALMVTVLRIIRHGKGQPLRTADAIVVFGAMVWPSGPSPTLRARVDRAAALFHSGWASIIFCSGGFSSGQSEADAMKDRLLGLGVEPSAIITDNAGKNTRSTICNASRFSKEKEKCIIAVSSPYHLYRIQGECRRQGIEAVLCPAMDSRPRNLHQWILHLRQHLRETAAVWWYAITGTAWFNDFFRPIND